MKTKLKYTSVFKLFPDNTGIYIIKYTRPLWVHPQWDRYLQRTGYREERVQGNERENFHCYRGCTWRDCVVLKMEAVAEIHSLIRHMTRRTCMCPKGTCKKWQTTNMYTKYWEPGFYIHGEMCVIQGTGQGLYKMKLWVPAYEYRRMGVWRELGS